MIDCLRCYGLGCCATQVRRAHRTSDVSRSGLGTGSGAHDHLRYGPPQLITARQTRACPGAGSLSNRQCARCPPGASTRRETHARVVGQAVWEKATVLYMGSFAVGRSLLGCAPDARSAPPSLAQNGTARCVCTDVHSPPLPETSISRETCGIARVQAMFSRAQRRCVQDADGSPAVTPRHSLARAPQAPQVDGCPSPAGPRRAACPDTSIAVQHVGRRVHRSRRAALAVPAMA
ncbi:uncharacterized protein C8Q71DRAFT_553206 [Rhodofomes roseus]|uniref:Uncharacterized protein n=1 Tax=Rhodofomes roseus TaxID=34475 RepID=A0ABQ8KIB0_9APHY|nr:uncharacterized protein C8Q71DRAFT_553206 [Rhodofomes roseus]KAH9837611.1 hypothetical protein C8Q71DRAFT_553206 [Rhodofomes roseus]